MTPSARRLRAVFTLVVAVAGPAAAQAPPRRVVSLNLTADEILVEILAPDRLIAVTHFADEPGSSNVVGRVPGGVTRLPKADLERVLGLRPDLVVVSEYTDADFLELLRRSGLRAHRMQGLSTLPGVRQAILDLGAAVGEPAAAARLVTRYDARLADLARRLEGARRQRVMYWSSPFSAGDGTTIGAIIEAAGGVNVGKEMGIEGIQAVGAERAYVADPDYLLVGSWPGSVAALREHPLLSQMPAVTQGRIVEMPAELLVALSHHVAEACWHLASVLHPDRVPAR